MIQVVLDDNSIGPSNQRQSLYIAAVTPQMVTIKRKGRGAFMHRFTCDYKLIYAKSKRVK